MHVHMHKRVQNAALRVEKIIFLVLYLTDALLWALTSKSRLSLSRAGGSQTGLVVSTSGTSLCWWSALMLLLQPSCLDSQRLNERQI